MLPVNEIALEWSSDESPLPVSDAASLISHLRVLDSQAARPIIVTVSVGEASLQVGVGASASFVHVSGEDGYSVSVGDETAQGVVTYFLHDLHHTEIQHIHDVPTDLAFAAAAQFFAEQTFHPQIIWEHVTYSRTS